jgi:hypothetical protein
MTTTSHTKPSRSHKSHSSYRRFRRLVEDNGHHTFKALTAEDRPDILYWPRIAKIPITGGCNGMTKEVFQRAWNRTDYTKIDFEAKLAAGDYDAGFALVLGKTLQADLDLYAFALDFDGWEAVEAWFGSWDKVLDVAKRTRLEWHGEDKGSLHLFLMCRGRPVKNIDIKNIKEGSNSHLEVRCENRLLYASPGIAKDGARWTVIAGGTNEIAILNEEQLLELESKIEHLAGGYEGVGYMSEEARKARIRYLEDPNTKLVGEHSGRHNAIVDLSASYFNRFTNGWKDLTDDQRHERLQQWNEQHCTIPLPQRELDDIWMWTVKTFRKKRDEQREKFEDEQRNNRTKATANAAAYPLNMPGCIYYQINSTPDRYVIGTTDYKLVELERKTKPEGLKGQPTSIIAYFVTNKTFTACKPVRIIKHKNPLSFLELLQRYTIEFKGSEPSGNFTIKHKTISEIVSELKNGNALCDSGIEVAITAQIKAFEKARLIEINDDMNYEGFFTDESEQQIISSNVDVSFSSSSLEDIDKLRHALEYINELAKVGYGPNRLDLLAHSILFGLIAPCSFIFKVIKAQQLLEWMYLYGKPNASKSTSGRIALAIDRHHKDDNYNVNLAHVDTIARLGDTISQTTFTKLVDEMDFTDNKVLANNVKSAIDQPRLRKVLDRSRRAEYVPALSPCIMTSNPPPPLNDAALMKRLAARYFPDGETHLKGEQSAKEFDALLSDLDKLQALGRFRNRFVMDNQNIILDKKLTPFEKARKILIAAYEAADMLAPCWLMTRQLEQNHLEESMVDAREAVLNAFESIIIDKTKNLKGMSDLTTYPDTSTRFMNLVNHKLLPFVKVVTDKAHQPTDRIAINTGVIKELYEYGITKDQLPNLKALADFIGGKYHKSDGKNVIEVSQKQLEVYFEEEEEHREQREWFYTPEISWENNGR